MALSKLWVYDMNKKNWYVLDQNFKTQQVSITFWDAETLDNLDHQIILDIYEKLKYSPEYHRDTLKMSYYEFDSGDVLSWIRDILNSAGFCEVVLVGGTYVKADDLNQNNTKYKSVIYLLIGIFVLTLLVNMTFGIMGYKIPELKTISQLSLAASLIQIIYGVYISNKFMENI